MVQIPTLRTSRLVLRSFAATDASAVEALLASPEIAATTLNVSYPYPSGAATSWIASHAEAAQTDRGVQWAIALPDTTVIGTIGLELVLRHQQGSVGYWLGVKFWNQGYMTEALVAVISWTFDALEMERIEAAHFPRNPASGRVMEKAGMVHEARRQRYIVKDGVSEDLEYYVILRPRYS